MANYRSAVITADTAGLALVTVKKPRSLDGWIALFNAYGGFGGGTLSYLISTDGGVTKTTCKDLTGVAYSTTTADAITMGPLGVPDHNTSGQQIIIYAALTGATNATLTIDVEDNS